MTNVACFCGCPYSFNGDEGACPKCGRVARVTAGPMFERPRGNGARQLIIPQAWLAEGGEA
jgi:hypothetical protein